MIIATLVRPPLELMKRPYNVLITLHRYSPAQAISPDTPARDSDRLLAEVNPLVNCYLPALTGTPVAAARTRAAYKAAWHRLFDLAMHASLILRDFHVDNLMGLPDRLCIRASGLLDFQDVMVGPVTYDLVSLLKVARRDIYPALAAVVTWFDHHLPILLQRMPVYPALSAGGAAGRVLPTHGIVLAASLSLRMRPLTNIIPKLLVRVVGWTLIDHTLDYLDHFTDARVERCVVQPASSSGSATGAPGWTHAAAASCVPMKRTGYWQ